LVAGVLLIGVIGLGVQVYAQNDTSPRELRYGETVSGTLTAEGVDQWAFTAQRGDILTIDTSRTAENLLPVVSLLDSDGDVLLGGQAVAGTGRVSLFGVRINQAGVYTIQVSSAESTTGGYALTVTNAAQPAMTVTPAPFGAAGTLQYGVSARGAIRGSIFEQVWRFKGTPGDVIDIRMVTVSGDLDPYISLVSPGQEVVGVNDNATNDGSNEAGLFSITLNQNGIYTIFARRSGVRPNPPTAGEYELTITLKVPGRGATALSLPTGGSLRGRLTRSAPVSLFRLEEGGFLGFRLELFNLHRLARVRILNSENVPIQTREGLSPLLFSTQLPDKGPYFVQISATNFDEVTSTDFTLNSYKLAGLAQPLLPGEPQTTRDSAQGRWFFVGRAGDLTQIAIKPSRGALNRGAVIRGPDDVVLFQGNLSPQFDQPLTLPADGVYQITVEPDNSVIQSRTEYSVRYDRFGANNVPFSGIPPTALKGELPYDKPTTGKLDAPETWTIDLVAGNVINLSLTASIGTPTVGLVVRSPIPDQTGLGRLIAAYTGSGTVYIARLRIPADGRYQITAFAPTGVAGLGYSLSLEDGGGGSLIPNQPAKGFVLPTNAYAEWGVDASAGSLINAQLTTRTPGIWTPNLYILDPAGLLIGQATIPAETNTFSLLGVEGKLTGRYRVIVGGIVAAAFASYEISVAAQPPFTGDTPTANNPPERPPLPRFAPAPPTRPPVLTVAELLNPAVQTEGVFSAELQTLPPSLLTRGEIKPGEVQSTWRVNLAANATVSIQAMALTGSVSPQLSLINRQGKIVTEELRGANNTTTLNYRTATGGDFVLVIRLGLNSGRYTLFYQGFGLRSDNLVINRGNPLVYGQLTTGEVLDRDQVDTYYFYGATNEVITVRASTLVGAYAPSLQVLSLGGRVLQGDLNPSAKTTVELNDVRLSENGVYEIRVQRASGLTESNIGVSRYSLYLGVISGSRLKNRIGGVLQAGETVTGALITGDNEDTWLMSGQAGESVTLSASSLDQRSEPSPLSIRLQDTAGNSFVARDVFLSQEIASIDNITLPADGLYRVVVSGGGSTQGGYRLTRHPSIQTFTPGIISYSQSVGGVITAQRNAETWTFSGNAGDVVSIGMTYVRGDRFAGSFQISAENGLALATGIDGGDGAGARVDRVVLPFTSSYTILIANITPNFKGSAVYRLSLTLQESKARSIGGLLTGMQSVSGELYDDDPADVWLFDGRGGDVIALTAQQLTLSGVPGQSSTAQISVKLKNRTGQVIAEKVDPSVAAVPAFTLPANGTYVVEVSDPASIGGRYGLALRVTPPPNAQTPTITYGSTVPALVADDRVTDTHLFEGRAGDVITARANREPGSPLSLILELYEPDGTLVARTDALGTDEAVIDTYTLPVNGTYRLTTTRFNSVNGKTAGRLNLSINGSPAELKTRGRLTPGQRGIGRLDDNTPADRWTYTGKAGDVIGIVARATAGDLDTVLTVLDPKGATIAVNDDPRAGQTTDSEIIGVRLPVDGVYTVILSRVGTRTRGSAGNYEIRADLVFSIPALPSTPVPLTPSITPTLISYGERAVGTIGATQPETRYRFLGDQADEITVTLLHNTDEAPPVLTIQDPAGRILAQGDLAVGKTTISNYRLPIRETFIISIRRAGDARSVYAPYTLTLTLNNLPAISPATGGVLLYSYSVVGALGNGVLNNQWLLSGSRQTPITISIIPLTGNLRPNLIIVDPAGRDIYNQSVPSNSSSLVIDAFPLSTDGIYTLFITGSAGQNGTYRLSVREAANGSTAPVSLSPEETVTGVLTPAQPEQEWRLILSAGDRVTIRALALSGDLLPTLTLSDAAGSEPIQSTMARTPLGDSAFFSDLEVKRSGEYTVRVRRMGETAGTYGLVYATNRAVTVTLAAAQNLPTGVTIASVFPPNRPALWVFTGKKGEAINVVALPGKTQVTPFLEVQSTTGETLLKAENADGEASIQSYQLPADGRYVVRLSASEGKSATYSLLLQRRADFRPATATGRTLLPGIAQQSGITVADQFTYWTINGKADTLLKLTLRPVASNVRLDVSVFTPSGVYLGGVAAPPKGGAIELGPLTLPEEGVYQVVVGRWMGPAGKSVGRYSITLEK
jgi:hypothetical protein